MNDTSSFGESTDVTAEPLGVVTSHDAMTEDLFRNAVSQNTASIHLFGESEIKVVSGETETWTMITGISLLTLWTLTANLLLVWLVKRMSKLNDPYYMIILVMSTLNSMIVFCSQVLTVVILLKQQNTSLLLCQVFTTGSVLAFLSTIYASGMLALERYFFFCHPFKYEVYFTSRRVGIMLAVILLASLAYVSVLEALFTRSFFFAMLVCAVEDDKIISIATLLLVFLPVTCTVIFAAVKLSQLIKRKKQQIGNLNLSADTPSTENVLNRKVTSALRQILMLSGLFCISQIPIAIISNGMVLYGITKHDVETRKAMFAFIAFRLSFLFSFFIAPAGYPFVILYINKSIRLELKKMFKRDTG